jgi:hypothetical protein
MGAREVWLVGGPVDGRFQLVESDTAGRLPVVVALAQDGFYLGCDAQAMPRVDQVYRRVDDIDGVPVYQHEVARTSS